MLDPIALAREQPDALSFERTCLDGLQREIGCEAAFFALPGERPSTIEVDACALEAALDARAYDAEVAPIKAAAFAQGGVAVDTLVLGERRVRATRYHREHAARIGGRHSLLAWLMLRGRPIGTLMLGRTGAQFHERDLDAIRGLLEPLALARASYGLRAPDVALPEPALSLAQHIERAYTRNVVRERARAGSHSVVVRDVGAEREMIAEDAQQALIWTRAVRSAAHRSGWFYVELFQLALARAHKRRRALFIGAGGGAAIHQFRRLDPAIAIDVVELEPEVLRLSARWYGLANLPGVCLRAGDGRAAVASAAASAWDVIVVDAYGASHTLPEAFTRDAFWDDAARVLAPGGALAINVIGSLAQDSPVTRLQAQVDARFEAVRIVPVLDAGEAFDAGAQRNCVLLASRGR